MVDDNSEYKKTKGVNRNVVARISHDEYKDVLLNKKCLRHSMDRIQSKGHRIGTYETNKISLTCFDHNIYIQNNGYDAWLFFLVSTAFLSNILVLKKQST